MEHFLTATFWHNPEEDLILKSITNNKTEVSWIAYSQEVVTGWLYGKINVQDRNGIDVAYVYPDFKTAIMGNWTNGELRQGKTVKVKGYR